ncbi:Crp/Fnr family transcriptional regulator [Halomonas sp. MA07-2]|uniref:Crp/Fnr family transcriptional regulator n=1 Tax=unclassified Halomonas TaxID=2609666 RepID=UPI003EEF7311
MSVVSTPADPRQNYLLAALPLGEYQRLAPLLQPVELKLGDTLAESGEKMKYGYFLTDAIVSLLCVIDDGDSAEIAVVGAEGVVGISLFMGGESTTSRAIVQSAGNAYRLKGTELKTEFHRAGALQDILLRYTQALIAQMAQAAVCIRHHSVDLQLCRWLLLIHDRLQDKELVMTQALIANMLGVRRESVTTAAHKLQSAGLISYHRGHIIILDRPGLEARVCECYQTVTKEYDRLLGYRTFPPAREIGARG